jgi:hypothetical protein
MARPDSYILLLNAIKAEINQKKNICKTFLNNINKIKVDPNYSVASTDIERSNFSTLETNINNMIDYLNSIVWE